MNANLWTKACALLLLTGGLVATPAAGSEVRMGLLNGPRGVQKSAQDVTRDMQRNGVDRGQRLNGTFRYSPGNGLMLGTKSVNLGPNTTVYPGNLDRRPEARDLHGKPVSVFGRVRPDGSIDAQLVIMTSADRFGIQLEPQKMPAIPGFVPSEANPLVGEIEEDQGG